MIRKTLTIALLLFLIAAVLYIYYYNSQPVTLAYSSAGSIQQPLGIIIIGMFITGALFAGLIGLYFGIKARWHANRLEKHRKELVEHRKAVADARGQLALGDYSGAQHTLAKIIHRDPDDVIARVLLAESFRRRNDLRGAQTVLEQARVEQKKNVELLLLASDVNAELGNHTAAYDNAALLLKFQPKNRFALERLVESCVKLNRLADAVDYQHQLIKSLSGSEYHAAQEQLAHLETLAAVKRAGDDKKQLRSEIEAVLRTHREFPQALSLLAELERDEGSVETAAKLWKKLFQITGEVIYLECIAAVWLRSKQPAKALSQVRGALSAAAKRGPQPEGRLFLANLLLHLEMIQEAETEFAEVEKTTPQHPELAAARLLFKSKLLKRQGKEVEALGLFLDSFDAAAALPGETLFRDAAHENGGIPPGWSERIQQQLQQFKAPTPRLPAP